jgi:signal peptidase II
VAAVACAIDQAHKWWMISIYDMPARQQVRVTPFFDLVMVWNPGISYGLFPQESALGKYILLALIVAVIVGLFVWLARSESRMTAVALGAIAGGAAGNVVDRIVHGAVADFFSFHAFGYQWYVFNLADTAIVAGVAIVLYESVMVARRDGDTS